MRRFKQHFLIFTLSLLLVSAAGYAYAFQFEVEGLVNGIRQGDVALVTVKRARQLQSMWGEFDGRKVLFQKIGEESYTALLGVDMNMKPGKYPLSLLGKNGEEVIAGSFAVEVRARDYKVERLTLPEKMVTPADKEVADRIVRESLALKRAQNLLNPERYWGGDFIRPVDGKFADNFGARRILNGISKKPHSGMDVKAHAGSPVNSPNGGKVVYLDNMYFGGKTVVIDHGHGLLTLYMHLSKILVNHGDTVDKGDVIGLVGSTGRSTGPHLHWGAYLNSAKIDPSSLLTLSSGISGVAKRVEEIEGDTVQSETEGKESGTLGGN
jgi:murein DD-endopeptidase MepM/ murein hydrolase activator NlpD